MPVSTSKMPAGPAEPIQSTDENAILRRILRAFPPRRQSPASLRILTGIGDDAAVLAVPAASMLAISTDSFLEGVHFLRRLHSPESIGYKALARAVSDLGAMGARPHSFLLALALPRKLMGPWLGKFLVGLRRASDAFQIPVIGGDTTCHPSVMVQVTVLGVVSPSAGILRSGACPGDLIFVTGQLGAAELGFHLLPHWPGRPLTRPTARHPLLSAHMFPRPPVELAFHLAAARVPSAMMDVSDGLSTDLARLCQASRVGARVEIARLPLVRIPRIPQAQERDPVGLALHGGEDYGLLFTVPPSRLARLGRLQRFARKEKITHIGEITPAGKIETVDAAGRVQPLLPGGWDPFRTSRRLGDPRRPP
jgi:thiamine-monophosphate kinase